MMAGLRAGDTVIVTGAGGLIGGWTVNHLNERGFKVVATDLASGQSGKSVPWIAGDVCDEGFISSLFGAHAPAAVVHCASMLQFACEANSAKATEINVMGTRNVLNAAIEAGSKRFVFLSTSAVYGPQTGILAEDALVGAPHSLLGVYSATKWLAERLGLAASRNGEIEFVAFRPGFVFGLGTPRSAGMSDVIQRMYKALLRGERFEVAEANGEEKWHFVHVSDICAAIAAALTASGDPSGVYNLAGPSDMHTSLNKFIAEVSEAAGYEPNGTLSGRATSGPLLDLKQLSARIGFEPTIQICDAVRNDKRMLEKAR